MDCRISSDTRNVASIGYRPGLDGLRAFAVAAVILYHGKISWAKGGFLGVDVFFVLSGFLITSLLLTEHEASGRIDLLAFWSRRARRLLPALFLLLAGVALYAVVWAQPIELDRVRSDGLASLLYVSNWKFIWAGTSYFQAFQAPSPLAHTWSLAIEEQWYLFWPLVLPFLMRLVGTRARPLAAVIAGLAIGSATTMAVLFHSGTDPSRVYYGTDTRAQALLVGAAFAALTAGTRPALRLDRLRRPWILQAAGCLGAAAVAVMIVRVDSTGAFLYRGGFLLAAVAAAALVAAASVKGPVGSVLSLRPLRAIGAISYGLYLWHWPVDVALDAKRTGLAGLSLFAAQLAVTLALATISYFAVEIPIRRNGLGALRLPARARRVCIPLAVASVAALLVLSTTGAISAPSAAAFERQHAPPPDPSKTRVLMLGDSQMFTLEFYGAARFTQSGPQYAFAPVIGCGVFDPGVQSGNCSGRRGTWATAIRTFDPDLSVLLIGAWETLDFRVDGHLYEHGTRAHDRELATLVTAALRPLTARHGRVALLEVPCFGESQGDSSSRQRDDPASVAGVNDALRAVARRLPGQVTYVPWADTICPGGHFTPRVNGIDVRPDGIHFAGPGAARLVTDGLAPVLRRLAVAAHRERSSDRVGSARSASS